MNSSWPIDGAERLDQGPDFLRAEHPVEARALDVEDLALERKDRLVLAVAALLGRAAGAVALDQEQLATARDRAPGSRRACPASEAMPITDLRLASRALRAASRAAAASIIFWMIERASPGCSSSHSLILSLIRLSSGWRTSELTSLSLVWQLNLGSGSLTETIAVSPSRMSSPVSVTFSRFSMPGLLGIIVDRAGQRRAERGHVRAAVALRDVVGERQDVLVIAVIPFERDVDADAVAHRRNGDRLGEQRRLGAVEIFDEGGDPALVIQLVLDPLLVPRIGEDQAHARVEEGELAVAMLEPLEVELGDLERLGARQEGDAGALLALGRRADDLQRRFGIAVAEAHEMLLAVAPDGEVEPFGKRVDDADADAVEAAGNLVGIVVAGVLELTAGVELGHDDLGRRHAFLGMDSGRDSAAIVLDRDRAVGVQLDEDPVAMAGERLVDRIVRDLEHHVVKARAVVGVADVHAGPLAHRVEALEDLDAVGADIRF